MVQRLPLLISLAVLCLLYGTVHAIAYISGSSVSVVWYSACHCLYLWQFCVCCMVQCMPLLISLAVLCLLYGTVHAIAYISGSSVSVVWYSACRDLFLIWLLDIASAPCSILYRIIPFSTFRLLH
jgi:hypothetical protein